MYRTPVMLLTAEGDAEVVKEGKEVEKGQAGDECCEHRQKPSGESRLGLFRLSSSSSPSSSSSASSRNANRRR